jgi:EamA domain-containing membrane protein RarD
MNVNLIVTILLFMVMHVLIWFSSNAQLVDSMKDRAVMLCLLLAIPVSLVSLQAVKHGYETLDSLWSVRLLGSGINYLVFPLLTWVLLKESPFNTKTMICIVLSFAIIGIQLWNPKG